MESFIYSFLAGISTVLGGVIIWFFGLPGVRILSGLLWFAGGIMIAISLFDLLPEALEMGAMILVVAGFLLGAGMMFLLDKIIPHAHMSAPHKLEVENVNNLDDVYYSNKILRTGYLIFLGIAIHNLPEGLAIGAGLEASPELGLYIAVAIGLHNIPEGISQKSMFI